MKKFTQPASRYPSEPTNDDDGNKELSFRSKGLTADDIQGIASLLTSTKELNLSDNAIDKLSRGFPISLVALDLSSNKFANLAGFENLRNIRMLKLQNNKISSTWGLQECVHLVHLDLSHNRIKVVEGLESLTKLKTLILCKNYIETMEAIRSLSFNTSLEDLNLRGNRVTIAPNYRGFTKHLLSSLKQLDGKSLYSRDGNRCPGYGVIFECKTAVDDVDTESVMTQINSHLSVSTVGGGNIPPQAAHLFFDNSFSSEESVISASSSQQYQNKVFKVGDDISDLPWRRPPSIIPKDVKGKELYDSNLNISPLNESKHKSKLSKSGNHSKGKKHHHHSHHSHNHHSSHHKHKSESSTIPPEKWDDNFVYESHGSPSKRVTRATPGNTNGQQRSAGPKFRGTHAGSGVLSKAILGSRHYSTPPPPPRKTNKYPLSLGMENTGAGALPLSEATIMVGNEALRVPLLASPGMVERLSPKKSASTTPLFPGAEQYWEGHVESLEHQEQNMTNHFREQVIQQQAENFRNLQRNAPPPPPLPSEQSESQYVGGESEDYYSNSDAQSREYSADDEDQYYSGSEGENHAPYANDRSGDSNSAHDFDDSREYYQDEDYYSGDTESQAQSERRGSRRDKDLTSQKRGTFFGLYSKNTPDSSGTSAHDKKHTASKTAVEEANKAKNTPPGGKISGALTSQRRGTFFGLYKKGEDDNKNQGLGKVQSANQADTKKSAATSASANSERKQPTASGGLTSQRRGTFFGLYKKKDEHEDDTNENKAPRKGEDPNSRPTPEVSQKLAAPTASITTGRKQPASAGQSTTPSEGLTSQRRGTFFGLYKKNNDNASESEENQNKNSSASPFLNSLESPVLRQGGDHKRDSPEELQNVLQQMYERKIETLRNLKASREQQQPTFVNSY